jgi:hypothetical protein
MKRVPTLWAFSAVTTLAACAAASELAEHEGRDGDTEGARGSELAAGGTTAEPDEPCSAMPCSTTPDAALAAGAAAGAAAAAAAAGPLYITGQNQWTRASSNNQNESTNDTTLAPGDPSPAAAELRVGNNPETRALTRSFMGFPIASVAGKQILAAKIGGRVDHTYKCGANRPTYVYRSAAIAAAPRQAWPGPALQKLVGVVNVHANETSCGEPNMPFEITSATLVSDLQASANANAARYVIALSAGENVSGLNEANAERWMRYFLSDFKLTVRYNSRPATPTALSVDGKGCVAGANRPFVKTRTPVLRARVTDPDGDTLDVYFAWAKWSGSAWVNQPGNGKQSKVPNGGTAVFTATGNVDDGIYTFRAQSNDSPSHTPFLSSNVTANPGNCEWQVDVSAPAVPTVSSDVYHEGAAGCPGGACGSVGQTGRFTFSSSPDTKTFLWGSSDPPTTPVTPVTLGGSVTVDWTPTSSGPRSLYVKAIDRAGNESTRVYQFAVAAESTALAHWTLADASGATELADNTGNGNSLTVGSGTLGAPGRIVPGPDGVPRSALQLDGSGDGGTAAGPIIADASKSFSVAASVKLAANTATQNVVDQGGATSSAFILEYEQTTNRWKLTAPVANGSAFPGAASTSTPRLNTWTHLVGTYDSAAKQMKLYVNGVLESTATGITVVNPNGPLRLGHHWIGALSDVQVWNRVISAGEVFDLSDPLEVGAVGEYHMGEVGAGPAFDASGMAHDLQLFNGAVIPVAGAGQTGTGLRLDGVDDFAAPDGQVLYTDQSFTVSVSVRPMTIAVPQTFVSQDSTGLTGGFSLALGVEGGGVWKFRIPASATDTDAAHATTASTPALHATTAFHHLIGVFDAQKLEIRLYVDGVLEATTPMNAQWRPWDATGRLLIGRHHEGPGLEPTSGDLDELRVYQGVVTDIHRIP